MTSVQDKPKEDPQTRAILDEIALMSPLMYQAIMSVSDPLVAERGFAPADVAGVKVEKRRALFEHAKKLFELKDFESAREICGYLAALEPGNELYVFTYAGCLQRTGQLKYAASFYAHCAAGTLRAISSYRLGECLQGLGRPRDALDAFNNSLTLAGRDPATASVAAMARKALQTLQATLSSAKSGSSKEKA